MHLKLRNVSSDASNSRNVRNMSERKEYGFREFDVIQDLFHGLICYDFTINTEGLLILTDIGKQKT